MTKITTIDDLDRDELLQLIRGVHKRHFIGFFEKDLVWARWEVASARTVRFLDEASSLYDQISSARNEVLAKEKAYRAALLSAMRSPRTVAKIRKAYAVACAALDEIEERQRRLHDKSDRQRRLADQLYAQYERMI